MINGACFKNAIISGANNISNNKDMVDSLNIFPVPDGDTGTNMSMTINSAAKFLETLDNDKSIDEISKAVASSMLRGARGNSGVILSLLFKGFSQGLKDISNADSKSLVKALGLGVKAAYSAVMNPAEGTILTVAREAFEAGEAALKVNADCIYVWEAICNSANESLLRTPELLPVLKKAGVVDAGGKGLCLVFEGMLSVFKDNKIIEFSENENGKKTDDNSIIDEFRNAAAEFDEDITFTYCTEFIVGRDENIETSPDELRIALQQIGDCVVVVDDEEIIKVHVHTENPGKALENGLKFGQLLTVKVENMKEQHRIASKKNNQNKKTKFEPKEPTEDVGFVAIAAGDGLRALFSDLGCNNVVCGGQTMNPSTQDILAAVMATPAKIVYVLPNNKNIIMAAEQVIPLVKDRKVIVIPTKTVPQGISAMLAFDSMLSEEECLEIMTEAIKKVSTGQVTFASRDSEYGGFKIKQGEILCLENGKLVSTEKDIVKATYRLTRSMASSKTSFVTLIYGEGVSDDKAEEVKKMVQSKIGKHVDVTLINGGQPIYYFIISVE